MEFCSSSIGFEQTSIRIHPVLTGLGFQFNGFELGLNSIRLISPVFEFDVNGFELDFKSTSTDFRLTLTRFQFSSRQPHLILSQHFSGLGLFGPGAGGCPFSSITMHECEQLNRLPRFDCIVRGEGGGGRRLILGEAIIM